MEIVDTFKSPLSCDECEFSTEKSEYTARHVALVHFKLESFLQNNELVAEKIAEYESSNKNMPKRQVHSSSPLVPERKSQRTFRPTTRFVSEEQPTLKCEQGNSSQKRKIENLSNGENGPMNVPAKKVGKFDIKQESGIKVNPLTELLKKETNSEERSLSFEDSRSGITTPKQENSKDATDENGEEEEEYEVKYFNDEEYEDEEGESNIVEFVPKERSPSPDHIIEQQEYHSPMSLLKKTLMKGTSPSGIIASSPTNVSAMVSNQKETAVTSIMKRRLSSKEDNNSGSLGGRSSSPKVQLSTISKSELQSSDMLKQLPPSISLTPALPKMNMPAISTLMKNSPSTNGGNSPSQPSPSSSINPQTIAEVNDSWAQSLMSKRSRPGIGQVNQGLEMTKTGSVSLTPAPSAPKTMPPSVTLTPSQLPKQPISAGIAKLIKLGSQKHNPQKGIGSVTLTPKGGSPVVSAQISKRSPASSSWNGTGAKGTVTLTPAGSKTSLSSSNTGSVSLTPAAPKGCNSNELNPGSGSVVKIKRATQAKWQLKGPPGVSVTPVTTKSNNNPGQGPSHFSSCRHTENTSTNLAHNDGQRMPPGSVGRTNYLGRNGEEEGFAAQMHIETVQDDSEREQETTDDDEMVHRMLLEPQVILDTSNNDQVRLKK